MNVLSDRVAWGYAYGADAEEWYGAKSRDEAIDNAAETAFDQESPAYITEGRWVSAAKCALLAIGGDMDGILERMDEEAGDNEVSSDGPVFELAHPAVEAEADLLRLLEEWAEKHVRGTRWMGTAKSVKVDVCRVAISKDVAGPTNWTDDDGTPYCCEYLVGEGATCSKHPGAQQAQGGEGA